MKGGRKGGMEGWREWGMRTGVGLRVGEDLQTAVKGSQWWAMAALLTTL